MRRNYLLNLLLLFLINYSYSQIGIGTTNPQSQLDIRASNQAMPSNTDGILIPKIDEFPLTNPTVTQDGMLVYITGNGLPLKGFYYWNNSLSSWTSLKGPEKINDLLDGKSDVDGTENGSSIFIGLGAGINDDGTDNQNTGIGFESLGSNVSGSNNVAIGYNSQYSSTVSNGNVSMGTNALYVSGGDFNTAIGTNTLTANNGNNNIAVGYSAMHDNTSGSNNTAVGFHALYSNTLGSNNLANGYFSLNSNTSGNNNVALGLRTLFNNTTGNNNIATGSRALFSNTLGTNNIAIGRRALFSNISGSYNVANGTRTLYLNTTGSYNVASGFRALNSNTVGNNNIAGGYHALYSNTSGSNNVSNGYESLRNNTTGYDNIASGTQSLYSNTTGDANVSIGTNSLYFNTVGINNTAIGTESGLNSNGDANIFLGYGAGYNETGSNRLYIENSDADDTGALIYGEFDTDLLRFNGNVTISNANATHTNATLYLNSLEIADLGTNNLGLDGDIVPFGGSIAAFDLGNNNATEHWDDVVGNTFVTFSDRQTKNNISQLNYGLAEILQLKPVSYSYIKKISANDRIRLGLIAQDVEKIIPEVVITEDVDVNPETGEKIITKGDYKAMSYTELIPVLIKAIQEQQVKIDTLEAKINTLESINN